MQDQIANVVITGSDTTGWVYKSRWGWHPCSHDHYLKLKELHKYWWMSHRRAAEHRRWFLKQPQNRVHRERKKTPGVGKRVVYTETSRPWPEPQVFVMKWDELASSISKTKAFAFLHGNEVVFDDKYLNLEGCGRHPGYVLNIPAEFNRARMPVNSPSSVRPLSIPEAVVDRLLADARAFYGIASAQPHATK